MNIDALWELVQYKGSVIALNLAYALIILVVGLWLAKWLRSLITKALTRANADPLLVKFGTNVAYAALVVFVALAAIGKLGIQTTSFVAVIGAAGLAIGLALQGSLSNFAAGVLVIIFRPYKIGDYIEGGGVAGTVIDVQIFTTELKTGDNRKIIVPNSKMTSGAITNVSAFETRRVDLVASVSYDDDIDTVRRLLEEVVAADPRVLPEPATNIRMNALNDSTVDWIVRPWVKAGDYWSVYWEMTEAIKRRFDAEGITIPFPQRDVHLYHHDRPADSTTTP
ncbi:mechanosensitive ion channel [Larsenimonas suaedae]|uniref:Small-conductance mechanosensitive channel n=2 Tax=Larsenimonas suaedae TaxID=1851019 RepID=A0ABU1GSL9_9GAMM|nr:mechanosensitive ion channel domain-containing protein [Larsenimonas suaedae]MCM2972180.1 mechanosensitive ion channel [Larsenimonas suaedae]MDR5895024.1 mechanosensitive ion channel [Larsenimonas suaedae]